MTKLEYDLVSKTIKQVAEGWQADTKYAIAISQMAYSIANAFQDNNPEFDKGKFLKDCMPE